MVGDFVVAEVDFWNVDCVAFESLAENDKSFIVETISEVVLIIAHNNKVKCVILFIGVF